MIEKERLNSADKRKVKLEIKQVLVSYLTIGIIITIVIAAAIILIQKSDRLPVGKGIAITFLLLAFGAGFAAFLLYSLKDYLKDLKSGTKRIISGHITDKPTNTNWGWHLNPAADLNTQPKLVEYFLVVDNHRVSVEEEDYILFEIGEKVNLYFTTKSNMLLGISKELRSGNKAQA